MKIIKLVIETEIIVKDSQVEDFQEADMNDKDSALFQSFDSFLSDNFDYLELNAVNLQIKEAKGLKISAIKTEEE